LLPANARRLNGINFERVELCCALHVATLLAQTRREPRPKLVSEMLLPSLIRRFTLGQIHPALSLDRMSQFPRTGKLCCRPPRVETEIRVHLLDHGRNLWPLLEESGVRPLVSLQTQAWLMARMADYIRGEHSFCAVSNFPGGKGTTRAAFPWSHAAVSRFRGCVSVIRVRRGRSVRFYVRACVAAA